MPEKRTVIARLKESSAGRAIGKRAVTALNERERSQPPKPRPRARAWGLQGLRLFDRLSDDDRNFLEANGRVHTYRRRRCSALDDTGEDVWIVLEGGIKLCRVSILGQRLIEALLDPGDVFGRVTSGGETVAYEVQALERSRLIAFPRPQFERLLATPPRPSL